MTPARLFSVYIPTQDGGQAVRLAADIALPGGLSTGQRVPAVLSQTRYWRAPELRAPFRWFTGVPDPVRDCLTAHGYALVRLDVRGTGASSGAWQLPWSPAEVADMAEVVAWLVAQPWCDGRVAGFGNSYAGTTAEYLAGCGHPAVRAALVRFNEFDVFTDIGLPGGIPLVGFAQEWSALNRALDANRHPPGTPWLQRLLVQGVRPVDGDRGRRLLRQAVEEHRANLHVDELLTTIDSRDGQLAAGGPSLEQINVCRRLAQIGGSPAAIESHGGWFDAATAAAVIHRFLNYPNLRRGLIGPWNHGATQQASPYHTGEPRIPLSYHLDLLLEFLQAHLGEAPAESERRLEYFTLGEEAWKSTTEWPPPGFEPLRLYLAAGNSLSDQPPGQNCEADVYPVDFTASTGPFNRWITEMGDRPVRYPDRAEAGQRLLTYTGAALGRDLELTGHPLARLYLSTTHTDGAVLVYLEVVEPDGRVIYLTEGGLRLQHRKLSTEPPPYRTPVPYRSFLAADRLPVVPGEVMELVIPMQPVSVRLRAGSRLRLGLAGADAGVFARLPESGDPVYRVERRPEMASQVEAPVKIL